MFCECEKIQLFSAVFCVVRTVHKFDFGLIINGTCNKCRLVFVTKEIASCSDRRSCVWRDLCVSLLLSSQ